MPNGIHRRGRGASRPADPNPGWSATRVLPATLGVACAASLAAPGLASAIDRTAAITSARSAITQAPSQSQFITGDTFDLKDVVLDAETRAHVRFARKHDGIPVIGGDLVVHLSATGALRFMTVAQKEPVTANAVAARSAASAQASAQSRFGATGRSVGAASLVYDATNGAPRLAHEVVVRSTGSGAPAERHVLTDADTGAKIRDWDAGHGAIGTGRTQYSGIRQLNTTAVTGGFKLSSSLFGGSTICRYVSLTSPCTDIVDADNDWGTGVYNGTNTQAADASYAVSSTLQFLESAFGRPSLFSDGTPLKVAVNSPIQGAFYDGKANPAQNVILGQGAEDSTKPFTSVDLVSHEIGHGLTEDTSYTGFNDDLGEPSGLNESIADVLGTLTEFHTASVTGRPANYTLGEDIRPGGAAYRSMSHPSAITLDGIGTPNDCWDEDVPELDKYLSSGLGNKFFFMLAEGSSGSSYGTAPTCGASSVAGIGRSKAAQIWYRALTSYLVSTSGYVAPDNTDARAATLYAAADLYGSCSTEYKAVQASWNATDIAGEDAICPPTIGTTAGIQQSGTDTAVNVITNIQNYGLSGTAKIEYGTTSSLGSTVTETIPVVDQYVFAFELTGLTPGTVYYYKVTNTTAAGTATTAIKTFVTSAPPQIASSGTSPSGSTGQAVNWSGHTFGQSGTLKVDYGTTTSFGSTVTRAIAASVPGAFSGMSILTGLTANTLYHYKVTLTTSRGTAVTAVKTFTTGQATPILTVGAPQALTSSTSLTGSPASTDWIHWKSTSSSTVDRRNVSPQRLTSFSKFGSGAVTLPASPTTTFSWTDAVGTASGSSAVGVATGAANGRGFWFNSSAVNTEILTLRVYVGVKGGTSASTSGQLTVSFAGDTTIAPVTSSVVTAAAGTTVDRAFDVTFRPRLGTDSLKVDWQQTAGGTSAGTAVVLYAATVR